MPKWLNILVWTLIGMLVIGTAAWTVWAGRQPRTHSIWAPDADQLPP